MESEEAKAQVLLEDEVMRDGLQLESRIFSLSEKIKLFDMLQAAGVPRVQVGSFVHPKVVPQMADTDELIQAIGPGAKTRLTALILNAKGLDRALASGIGHVSMSVSISDAHSRKNANRSAEQALSAMLDLVRNALAQGLDVRGGLQSAFGCVYEGAIDEEKVIRAAEQMAAVGVKEINLADSTGMASPLTIRSLVGKVRAFLPELQISLHLHDTRGMGMANMFAGYEAGVRTFDVCAGGLGGCPFIKGAAGNVATEDAAHMFAAIGAETGVDVEGVVRVVDFLEAVLERSLPGKMKRVIDFRSCRRD